MKYLLRLIRWLHCRHKWSKSRLDEGGVMMGVSDMMVFEQIDPNRECVKICMKCGEVRTCGKKVYNIDITGSK